MGNRHEKHSSANLCGTGGDHCQPTCVTWEMVMGSTLWPTRVVPVGTIFSRPVWHRKWSWGVPFGQPVWYRYGPSLADLCDTGNGHGEYPSANPCNTGRDHLRPTCVTREMVIESTLRPTHVVQIGIVFGQPVWHGYNMDLGRGPLTRMNWAIVNLGGPCGTGKVTERAGHYTPTPPCVWFTIILYVSLYCIAKKLPNMFSRMKASIDRYKLSLHTRYLEHRTLRYDYLCVWLTNILYVSYAERPPNESRTRSAEWKLALTATNRVFIQDIWSIEHWDMIISVFGYKYIICASNDHTQHVWCLPKATLAH
jgi:hypothetical protein